MRVVVSAGAFDTLTPSQACAAICEGWHERAPHVELIQRPMSAGGAGFLDALASTGRFHLEHVGDVPVARSIGDPNTAYLAQSAAVGAADVARTILELRSAGTVSVVVGVGGSQPLDSAQTFVAALAAGRPGDEPVVRRARDAVAGLRITAVVDHDRALLGMQGACFSAIEERGIDRAAAQDAEAAMGAFVDDVRRAVPAQRDLLTGAERRLDRQPGAGAGGGVAYAILALGGEIQAGPHYVADTVRLSQAIDAADLVVAATPIFDWRVLQHSVLSEVTTRAAAVGKPAVVLADEVHVGRRETMNLGLSASYARIPSGRRREDVTEVADPSAHLRQLAHRVAGTWSPVPR